MSITIKDAQGDGIAELPLEYAGPCIVKLQGMANAADIDCSAGFDGYLLTN